MPMVSFGCHSACFELKSWCPILPFSIGQSACDHSAVSRRHSKRPLVESSILLHAERLACSDLFRAETFSGKEGGVDSGERMFALGCQSCDSHQTAVSRTVLTTKTQAGPYVGKRPLHTFSNVHATEMHTSATVCAI